jgi:arginyl-tRNA synthetase
VVFAAAEKINDEWKGRIENTVHVPHGRMSFKGQRMASRLGGVPTVVSILDTTVAEVANKNPDVSYVDAEKIAIASLKFSILRAAPGKNIDFDPDTSLSFEGDSGPYLQYSAVRAKSVLAKAQGNETDIAISDIVPESWQTTTLEKVLIHFPEIVERAISDWAPHHIVSYLLELAQTFNSWYGNTKIIDANDPTSGYKLALTNTFATVMKNGLYLLGIEVPEKM